VTNSGQTSRIPFREIQDKAIPHVEALCRRWLASGHRSGNWWIANCPWRKDDTASLGVSLTTGRWQDFGAASPGREKGDLVKLFSCIYGSDLVSAADAVAQIVGHPFRQSRRA
jgi:DNA primase